MPMPTLSLRHQAFVDALFQNGMNQSAAYRAAGYRGKNADVQSAKVMAREDVRAEVRRRQMKLEASSMLDADQANEILSTIARDESVDPKSRISAIGTWAKLTGHCQTNGRHTAEREHEDRLIRMRDVVLTHLKLNAIPARALQLLAEDCETVVLEGSEPTGVLYYPTIVRQEGFIRAHFEEVLRRHFPLDDFSECDVREIANELREAYMAGREAAVGDMKPGNKAIEVGGIESSGREALT